MEATLMQTKTALAAALVGNVIFGFSFLFTRLALTYASPYVLLSCRFALAFLVMTLLLITRRANVNLRGKPWPALLLLGLFQPVLYFFGENYGVLYTSSTFSSVLISLVPIVTMVLSSLFLKENASRRQILFSLVSVLGVVIITSHGNFGGNQLKGVLLLLLAVFSSSAYYLFTRKLAENFTPFERTYMMFAVGLLVFLSLALGETHGDWVPFADALRAPVFLWAILYLGILSSVIAFFFINYANSYLPVTRTSIFSNLITVVSVFAGVVFLREPFSPLSFCAAGMILLGVWGVQRPANTMLPTASKEVTP